MDIIKFKGGPVLSDKKSFFLAKLEGFNPGGSVKDRPSLRMIEVGEKKADLTKDKIILEATSGNTGIGLSHVAAVKGYRCLLVMSEAVSDERKKILRAMGADLKFTPAHLGTDGAIEFVYNLVLGVLDMGPAQPDSKVEELIKKREKARGEKNWAAADYLRQELWEMGIELIDTKDGPIWRKVHDKQ